jgi:transcriptional regulator with XRE-family HTH domain
MLAQPREGMHMFDNFGRALRFVRETKGKSQAYVAERAKVGKSQISKYETGKELPKLESLQRILEVLEVAPYQIFYAMHLLNQSEESVRNPLETSVHGQAPDSGVLTVEAEDAFKDLWASLFRVYNVVVGDRIRAVPKSDLWTS